MTLLMIDIPFSGPHDAGLGDNCLDGIASETKDEDAGSLCGAKTLSCFGGEKHWLALERLVWLSVGPMTRVSHAKTNNREDLQRLRAR